MSRSTYHFGEFRFLASARELYRAGNRVELPRRSFECIEHLLSNRERAVGRDELVNAIFGRSNVSDAQLGQIVLRARRALDDDGNAQRVIRTVAGFGYRWVAQVEERTDATAAASDALAAPVALVPGDDASRSGDVALVAPRSPRARTRHRFAAVLGALLAVAAASAVFIALPRRVPVEMSSAEAGDADRVVVLPIEIDGLREDGWVRLGAMDLVADRLRDAGFGVPPSEDVLGFFGASVAPAARDLEALRRTTGARLIVHGTATHDAKGWKVDLAASAPGRIPVPVQFSGHDPIQATRGASDLLLAALGRRASREDEHDLALDETLQRARAAMLANELDTAREILAASPQLAALPDQLAFRLAQVDFRAGRLDQVEAALDRLLGKAAVAADARFRAQILVARGTARTRRGAFADGSRDFDAALAAIGPDGDVVERAKARLGCANGLVAGQRHAEALVDFSRARIDFESGGDLLGVARVDANLGMLELYRGRPAAALGFLPAAADRFQSFGALHELLLTLTGLVDAQLSMLQRDEAAATIERASLLRQRITDPDQRIDLLLNRAQASIGSGRLREATAALAEAGAIAASGNPVLDARRHALEADLALHERRWDGAARAARSALAAWPAAGADGDRAGVVLIAQRALLAAADDGAAEGLLDRRRAAPTAAVEQPGAVADALAMAEWAGHRGDAVGAEAWLDTAAASADRRGVPAEIVAVAQALAPLLLAQHRTDEAAAAIGRVAPWAGRDFDAALLQLRLFHVLGQREPWFDALRQAQRLAGEREIPAELLTPRSP